MGKNIVRNKEYAFIEEIEIFNIGAVLYQHRIAIYAGVDALLDGRVVGRYIDYPRERCGREKEE